MRLTTNRGGGFHVIVILPQQFTKCLKTSDSRVRFVRANLMWTGVIFSGDLDTDIRFGHGMFSLRWRRDISRICGASRLLFRLRPKQPKSVGGTMNRVWAAIAAVK
jgi:hypothetical protein